MKNQKSKRRSNESLFERAFLSQATDIYSRWRYFKERDRKELEERENLLYQRKRNLNKNWKWTKGRLKKVERLENEDLVGNPFFSFMAKASLPKPGKGYQRERKEYLDFKNTNWNEAELLNNLFFKRFPQPQLISSPNEGMVVFRLFLDYF